MNPGPDNRRGLAQLHALGRDRDRVPGPNRAPKPTTPRLMLGLASPSAGYALAAGAAGLTLTARRDINQENTCKPTTNHRLAPAAAS